MITENEMQISNMSYTEKDFASIYPALLDLVKQLTNKWDPSISNESDPGNVLLKLLAAVGDKTNYNIDKNVLECFMPSATQETSMRMLTEAVGYNMKYYQSAMTDISFKYTGDLTDKITFNRFSTVISNQDDSVAYTLIEDVTLAYKNVAVSGMAIEGQLTDLLAGDNVVIKLENIDDNNRLYFPEIYVAENGVFITNDGTANFDEWTKVDNLNTQQPLTRCYKFGYDSKAELPYIEFPTDIAQLLGSGIRVSYIVTTADAGNVSAGVLNTLASSNLDVIDTDNLVIFNPASSVNGKTKETIDEAYNNFKRIIGTFDTLVTTRDYGNAMYNFVDEYNEPIVSNAMASDRTDDINYGLNVVTYDQQGQYVELIPTDDLTVSDLVLYPMKPYKGENYSVYNPSTVYDESYTPLKTYKVQDGNEVLVDDEVLVSDLEELKCIGHTFKDLPTTNQNNEDRELVYNFRNIANLDVQIFTYAKVNAIAQADIKNNVLKALSDNFNARMVDYGYEIPYNKLLDVIYGADSRIKLVNLGEPEYKTEILYADGSSELVVDSDGEVMTDVIAKNILAGKLSLFLYDNRFDWQFGQTDITTYDNITAITTTLAIPTTAATHVSGGTFSYTLDKNEVIQLISPTLSTSIIYPAGVYYRFTKVGSSSTDIIAEAGKNYKLDTGETLKLYYIDSNEVERRVEYTSGTIIKPTFDLRYTTTGSITLTDNGSQVGYDKINTNKTLEIRDFVTIKLDNIGTPIYWIRNNANNVLFDTNEMSVILDANEYFIYSNSNFDDLVVLGAGTSITRVGDTTQWAIADTLSLESINLNGVNAFRSGDWQYKQLTANKYLTLQEMQIITVSEGATVEITNWDNSVTAIGGSWTTLDNNSTISIVLSDGSLPDIEDVASAGISWKIRTRLDINAGPDTPQILLTNDDHGQTFEIALTSGDEVEIEGTEDGKQVLFNYPVMMAGGNNIDMKVTNVLLGTTSYALSVCEYTAEDITGDNDTILSRIDPSTNINLTLDRDFYVQFPISIDKFETEQPSQLEIAQGASLNYNYQPYATYIVPLLFTQGSTNTPGFTLLTSKPSDWDTNYKYYYIHPIGYDGYVLNTTNSTWATNSFYKANTTTINIESNCADLFDYNVYDNDNNKVELSQISEGGLYNLELVAKWQGDYATEEDLDDERPEYKDVELETPPLNWPTGYYTKNGSTYTPVAEGTTFSAGTYYVKPNQTGDICRVGDEHTLYMWDGSDWVKTTTGGETASDYYLKFSISVDKTQAAGSFLTIGKINKILDLNAAISSSIQGDLVLQKIASLTDGITNSDGVPVKFYYTYEPSNSDVIEVNNIISPQAFWDVNNIANKFTIPKLDLANSNIYIARASQL